MGVADLEELLRANLKLRGELAVEVAKAVEPVPLNHKILTMKRFDWWLNRLSPKGPLPWWSITLHRLAGASCSSNPHSNWKRNLLSSVVLVERR
jgi:hypothetical protein